MNVFGGTSLQADSISPRGDARQLPLFVILEGHGVDEVFGALAERGDGGLAIHALPARAADGSPARTLEGQAAALVEAIRTIQPQGPYRLAAWPGCALLAYEIGTQLVGQDQRVAFIGLVGDMVRLDGRVYQPQAAAALPVHLFVGESAAPAAGLVPWRELLPHSQLQVVQLAGHVGADLAPGRALGRALSGAVHAAAGRAAVQHEADYDPLLTIQSGTRGSAPVFCFPGAGDSATGFTGLAFELGRQWPVHGLQPRGVEGLLIPHSTVQAAAARYLRAIVEQHPAGPVHLVGHSFGGWIAFEVATLLRKANRQVASLTLIDSEAPGQGDLLGSEHSASEVASVFADSLALAAQQGFYIDSQALEASDESGRLVLLHGAAVRAGLLPARSRPDLLKGCLRTFGTALRTVYRPAAPYPGPVRLVLVDDASRDAEGNARQQRQMEEGWRKVAPDLSCWRGPGNHMSILKAPHAGSLARWWLAAQEQRQGSTLGAEHRELVDATP